MNKPVWDREYRKAMTEGGGWIEPIRKEIYAEYCRIRTRMIYYKIKSEFGHFSYCMPAASGGVRHAYSFKLEFSEYNPSLAHRLSPVVTGFVDGLHFRASKAYCGKYTPLTYYISPDWEYWKQVRKDRVK